MNLRQRLRQPSAKSVTMGEEIVECKGTTWKPEVSPLQTSTACYGRNFGLLHWLEADLGYQKLED